MEDETAKSGSHPSPIAETSRVEQPVGQSLDEPQSRRRRKSIRTRPPAAVDNYDDKPLPPLTDLPREPSIASRKSNMSLFSIFNRPKVQRQRGYVEQGLTPTLPYKSVNPSRLDIAEHTSNENPRSFSALSFRTKADEGNSNRRLPDSTRSQTDRRQIVWDAPPLFQAFAQSTKHGLAEISTATAETVLAKSRAGRGKGLQIPTDSDPRASTETGDSGRMGRTAVKGLGHGASPELQRKIFVLVTSGYLLQYSEHGPSGRLPERVLPLGEDSAVFASDMIPGQHYVLQISQAVDSQGLPIATSGSLFSRMGLRTVAAKRTVSNVWLILPDAKEMDSWLHAVRKQLEMLSRARTRTDTSVEVRSRATEEEEADLAMRKVPSLSHRYQVARSTEGEETAPVPVPERSVSPMPPPKDDESEDGPADKPKTSLEEAEEFADKLAMGASYVRPKTARARSPSDAPSISSSVAQSFDHQRLNSLRSSARMSSTSNATAMTSRTNSLTSEPASNKPSLETNGYRTLSSYGSGSGKRRSAMPAPSTLQVQPETDLSLQLKIPSPVLHLTPDESPVVGRGSPLMPAVSSSPIHSTLQPKQSLPIVAEQQSRHDSEFSPTSPVAQDVERPQSFISDLPSPFTWAKSSPAKRSQPSPMPEKQMQRMSSAPTLRNSVLPPKTNKRMSSQPFNLPLRVNPSVPTSNPSAWSNRASSAVFTEEAQEAAPKVHTLEAKVDPQDRCVLEDLSNGPKPAAPERNPARTASQKRLSLFPTPLPMPPGQQYIDLPKRSPSITVAQSGIPSDQRTSLKRPISIQIRADPAPFLSSMRPANPPPTATQQTRSFTPPIRSLKPSRSSAALPTTTPTTRPRIPVMINSDSAVRAASPTDPFSRPASRSTVRSPSPGPNQYARHPSNMNFRAPAQLPKNLRTMSSLPALDLGLPLVGLGPPAPPPSAPLPMPPPTAPLPMPPVLGVMGRPSSPLPMPPVIGGIGMAMAMGSRPSSPLPVGMASRPLTAVGGPGY